jgi:hypothetical protein
MRAAEAVRPAEMRGMSALGQTRKSSCPTPTSASPFKADMQPAGWDVRFVPGTDVKTIIA